MADDDFLADVAAVASGIPQAPEPVADPQITTVAKSEPLNQGELVDSLTGEKRKTLTTKKKEEKPAEAEDAPEGEEKPTAKPEEKPQQQTKKAAAYMDRFFTEDKEGNLLLSDGSILAAKGNARAVFEGLKKEARDARAAGQDVVLANVQLSKKFKALYTDFKAMQENGTGIAALTKETGMTAAEITEATNLMKVYKRDPLAAIKSLLTQAHANGIDVSSLGVKTSLDIPTLVRMLKDSGQAPVKETTDAPSEENLLIQAREEVSGFMSKYPDAAEHVDTIAAAKRKFPEASLEEIWIKLQRWLSEKDQQASEEAAKAKPITRVVKPSLKQPLRDYSRMSFADIAASIQEEMNQ